MRSGSPGDGEVIEKPFEVRVAELKAHGKKIGIEIDDHMVADQMKIMDLTAEALGKKYGISADDVKDIMIAMRGASMLLGV